MTKKEEKDIGRKIFNSKQAASRAIRSIPRFAADFAYPYFCKMLDGRSYSKRNMFLKSLKDMGKLEQILYSDNHNPDIASIEEKYHGLTDFIIIQNDLSNLTTPANKNSASNGINKRLLGSLRKNISKLYHYRELLCSQNYKLAVIVSKEYYWSGMDEGDLLQEGLLGLWYATGKFDYRNENKFSTYAVWWIRQAILKSIDNHVAMIRVSSKVKNDIRRMLRVTNDVKMSQNGSLDTYLIAKKLNWSERKITDAYQHFSINNMVSLDKSAMDDGEPAYFLEFKNDFSVPNSEEQYLDEELKLRTRKLISTLSEREQTVLRMRYAIGEKEKRTLDYIGRYLGGLSRERVRQIEARALRKCRDYKRTDMVKEFIF